MWQHAVCVQVLLKVLEGVLSDMGSSLAADRAALARSLGNRGGVLDEHEMLALQFRVEKKALLTAVMEKLRGKAAASGAGGAAVSAQTAPQTVRGVQRVVKV